MVPAPRPAQPPSTTLRDLKQLHTQLPPPRVRWQTRQGQDFLDALRGVTMLYGVNAVAQALSVTRANVYKMLKAQKPRYVWDFPTPQDLRALNRAWVRVEAMHRQRISVRRWSAEFAAVHHALVALDERFKFEMICAAMRVEKHVLKRYLDEPLTTASAVAAVERGAQK